MAIYNLDRSVLAVAVVGLDARYRPIPARDRLAAWIAVIAPIIGIAVVTLATL